jgi:hypothetical protein
MCDDVAKLIINDGNAVEKGRDINIESVCVEFKQIYETYILFVPLQYPLLFPLWFR